MAIIGIDATALSLSASGGIGTSQYQTMRALAEMDTPHRFVLYAASPPLIPFSPRPLDLPWPVRLGSGVLARRNILWMQTGVNRLLAEDRVDLFWGPRHLLPFFARGLSKVATVHDFWDRDWPAQQPWLNHLAYRLLVAKVIAHADVVVTPSIFTAGAVARSGHSVRGGVHVVPWGVDRAVFRPLPAEQAAATLTRLGVRPPYVLSLDVFNGSKNFLAVLKAVFQLPDDLRRSLTVVALGGPPRRMAVAADPVKEAEALGLRARLRLLGGVSLADLTVLYAGALAFVHPSFLEGFGMPVLEAMACGCPVITSDRSSLAEVAGNAALLVDPTRADHIAHAITVVARDAGERSRLVAAGTERAGEFTWQRTAEGMMEAFERALVPGVPGAR